MTEVSAQQSPEGQGPEGQGVPGQSPGRKRRASIPLAPRAREVHQRILAGFAATGGALRRADLADFARAHGFELDPVLAELGDRDMVVFDDRGEIRAAYPFSPSRTAVRLSWAGGPVVYAMCAIDALGVSAMLGRPVTITAAEPGSGRVIIVEVDCGQAHWSPGEAVVYAGTTGSTACPSADRACGYINFFTSADAAQAWAASQHGITGKVLDQAGALRFGIAEFGTLMRPA
jgi:alkylmercury lyase-like protein